MHSRTKKTFHYHVTATVMSTNIDLKISQSNQNSLQHGMLFKREGYTFFRAHFMQLHGIGKSSGNLSSVVIVGSRSSSSIWYPTFSGFSSMDCSKGEWYHKYVWKWARNMCILIKADIGASPNRVWGNGSNKCHT